MIPNPLKNLLSFLNFLDDILKQFTIVGSLKEQQADKHKNLNIFLRETTREKTLQNFLSIELNQSSVKPKENASLFFMVNLLFSLLQTCLSECVQMNRSASLFIFIFWLDLEPSRADLSSKTPKTIFIIMTLGYYWPDLHP